MILESFESFNEKKEEIEEILKNSEMDKNYLDECFIEFIDSGSKTEYLPTWSQEKHYREFWQYTIEIVYERVNDMIDLSNYVTKLTDDSEELKVCLSKVKIKYPDIRHMVKIINNLIIVKVIKSDINESWQLIYNKK